MDACVVDASVVVKWFSEEEFSLEARRLRDDYVAGSLEIQVPALLPFEVLNALHVSDTFSAEELVRVAETLDRYALLDRSLEGSLSVSAVRWAVAGGLTVYDAAYAVLAQELDVPLYSADEQLLKVSRGKVEVYHIRSYPKPKDSN